MIYAFVQTVSPASTTAPGGLYVGYYAEDPATNSEDPTTGAVFFSLPAVNGSFSGSMYFTFLGCQSSNIGVISGTRTDNGITGTWSGSIDGLPQSGTYVGSYDPLAGFYSGGYTVAAGKQFVAVPACIQYYIAPLGTWEAFPPGTNVPATFALNAVGTVVSWTQPIGAFLTLTAVIDEVAAIAGTPSAVTYQNLSGGISSSLDLSTVSGLVTGKVYIVTVAVTNGTGQRIALASVQVTRGGALQAYTRFNTSR